MNEAQVEKKVSAYFIRQFPQFSVSQQCTVSFGTQHNGIADVVLYTDAIAVIAAAALIILGSGGLALPMSTTLVAPAAVGTLGGSATLAAIGV